MVYSRARTEHSYYTSTQIIEVPDNLPALKFDNFTEFQSVNSDSPSTLPTFPLSIIMIHCVRTLICVLPLSKIT